MIGVYEDILPQLPLDIQASNSFHRFSSFCVLGLFLPGLRMEIEAILAALRAEAALDSVRRTPSTNGRSATARQTIPDKVAKTPEFDLTFVTFMNKNGKDLPRNWNNTGQTAGYIVPLRQLFLMADEAPHWTHRFPNVLICMTNHISVCAGNYLCVVVDSEKVQVVCCCSHSSGTAHVGRSLPISAFSKLHYESGFVLPAEILDVRTDRRMGDGLLRGAVLCACFISVAGANITYSPKSGRSFIFVQVETSNGSGNYVYTVNDFAANVLTGRLTTVFLPFVYIVVFIVGLPSNAIALWVFFFRTKKKHPAMIYMANLAMADLMFVIWLPLKIYYHVNGSNWIYGEAMCKLVVGFFYGNMYCSILFMTCLSVQRYWVIVNPISHARKKSRLALIISVTIWILIMLSTIPLYLFDQTVYIAKLNITTCHDVLPLYTMTFDMFNYFISLAVGLFFFPAVLTTLAYTLMIKTLNASITDENIGKKRKRAIRLIITVLVMYLLCFIPSNILIILHYSFIKSSYIDSIYALYIVALCLSSMNSCIDPFVYYYVSQDFRENVKNTFKCQSVRNVERMRISFSSMKYSRKSSSYTSSSNNTKTSNC
ncbi:proteinase-activated receptor 2-like [Pelodytes ibericus]